MLPREKTQVRYQTHSIGDPRFYFFKLEKMDKDDGINVLSLFDWMSCGMIALERAWIKVNKYFACEIDKYATQVSEKNYSNIIRLWDVNNWRERDLWEIDLIIWWSPCQWFSFAGKQLAFDDPRSKLFFTMVDIINHYKPKYFLLENVKMKKEYQDVITEYMWAQPIEINSALVSAQNRRRLYWTNITWIEQPQDKWIMLKDILEDGVDERYYLTISEEKYIKTKCSAKVYGSWKRQWNMKPYRDLEWKSLCITSNQRLWRTTNTIRIWHFNWWWQWDRVYSKEWKSVALSALWWWRWAKTWLYNDPPNTRKLTPIECERLQTVPDNYTEWVSNSQRYKILWNWWTVDVITHIFSYLK